MNPDEKQRLLQRIDTLETLVNSLIRVENVPFIENIKRRGGTGVRADGTSTPTSMTVSVRNAADSGSETVCQNPDSKLKIILPTGDVLYLPAFNS